MKGASWKRAFLGLALVAAAGSLFVAEGGAAVGADRLHAVNLVYGGAFAFPPGDEWNYSGHAMTFYPRGDPYGTADGHLGSLYVSGHVYDDRVGEITIPEPAKTRSFDELPKARVLRPLSDITGGWKDNCTYAEGCEYREVDGLQYLPGIDRIAWNLRDWYNVAGFDQDSLGWSRLDMTDAHGVWHIGERGEEAFHNGKTCNYLFLAPESFAEAYLGGRMLIAGNHREAGAFGGSQGPTLYALAPWNDGSSPGSPPDPGQDLDALALLYYPETEGCLWDDPTLCLFPGYRARDAWGGGAWVEAGGRGAVLIFGRKGLGENCYGDLEDGGCEDPCDASKGYHAYPYEPRVLFYDPEELKLVASGDRQPWEVVPYEVYRPVDEMFDPACGSFGAVAYDRERGYVYATERTAGPDGQTVVHVWKVRVSACQPGVIVPLLLTQQGAGQSPLGNVPDPVR